MVQWRALLGCENGTSARSLRLAEWPAFAEASARSLRKRRLMEQRGFSRILRDPANGGRTLSIMRDVFLIQGIGCESLVEQRGFEPLTSSVRGTRSPN